MKHVIIPFFIILYVLIVYILFCPIYFFLVLITSIWNGNLNEFREFKKEWLLKTYNEKTGHYWGYKNPIDYLQKKNGIEIKDIDQEAMDELFDQHMKNNQSK